MTSMRDTDGQARLHGKSLAVVCQFAGFGLLLSLVSTFGPAAGATAIAAALAMALAVVVAIGLGFGLAAAVLGTASRSSSLW
jgi:hypothetical protein